MRARGMGRQFRENTLPTTAIRVPVVPGSISEPRSGEFGVKNGPWVSAGVGSSSSPHSGVGARSRVAGAARRADESGAASTCAASAAAHDGRSAPAASPSGAAINSRKNLRRLSSMDSPIGSTVAFVERSRANSMSTSRTAARIAWCRARSASSGAFARAVIAERTGEERGSLSPLTRCLHANPRPERSAPAAPEPTAAATPPHATGPAQAIFGPSPAVRRF